MTRKKRISEAVDEYFLVMREIASHAKIEAEVVIQYTVDGIQVDAPNKIVLDGAETLRF